MRHGEVVVESETSGAVICAHARVASTFVLRFIGLLGTPYLPPGDGLLLRPSSAVHTFGMTYPIDVVALDREGRVLAIRPHLPPQRIALFPRRSHDVLELAAGEIGRRGVKIGNQLRILPGHPVTTSLAHLQPVNIPD